jgi:hypothetical protein
VVATGGSKLERNPSRLLTSHIGKVGFGFRRWSSNAVGVDAGPGFTVDQRVGYIRKAFHCPHPIAGDQLRNRRVNGRHQHQLSVQRIGERQRPGDRTYRTVETKFAKSS